MDVAVANSRSSSFSMVVRLAGGGFWFPTRDYVVAGGTPLAITSGDYNSDGLRRITSYNVCYTKLLRCARESARRRSCCCEKPTDFSGEFALLARETNISYNFV